MPASRLGVLRTQTGRRVVFREFSHQTRPISKCAEIAWAFFSVGSCAPAKRFFAVIREMFCKISSVYTAHKKIFAF